MIARAWHGLRAWFLGMRLRDHAQAVEELRQELGIRQAQLVKLSRELEHEARLSRERT